MKIFTLLLLLSTSSFANQKDLDLLKEMVSVSSGTADASGVNSVQKIIAAKLKAMNFKIEYRENAEGANKSGKILIAELPGKDGLKFITLVGHADTVFEKLNPFMISSDQKRVMGSGVGDDKGGVVVGIHAFEEILKNKFNHPVRFVISPNEETGSGGFHPALEEAAKDSILVLGLEPARGNGAIVLGRKGNRWYHVSVSGKEAHAGVDHEKGINACLELSMKITALQKLTDYKKSSTVSIGRIEGGKDKYNIVCGHAEAKIDTRFSNTKSGNELNAAIEKILKTPTVRSATTKEPTQIKFEVTDEIGAFFPTHESHALIEKYAKIVQKIEGKKPDAIFTGGVGDLNKMARDGLMMIDGLGPIGDNYHTNEEYIEIESLETRKQALVEFLLSIDASLK